MHLTNPRPHLLIRKRAVVRLRIKQGKASHNPTRSNDPKSKNLWFVINARPSAVLCFLINQGKSILIIIRLTCGPLDLQCFNTEAVQKVLGV